MSIAAFHLTKWYFDCIAAEGETFIGYAGLARYGGVSLSYASALRYPEVSSPGNVSSLRPFRAPLEESQSVRWTPAGIGVTGCWSRTAPPLRASISPSIEWRCCFPRADARVLWADGSELRGLGYVEQLTMTEPPWQLPLRTLRWGRFVHPASTVVWIDWIDAFPAPSRRFVFYDGVAVESTKLGDREILLPGARLVMDCGAVLRSGPLGRTALSALRRVLPAKMLGVTETKWRSRATLQPLQGPCLEGWAIHETVDWESK